MSGQMTAASLNIPEPAIVDLRERLARTRFPDQAPGPAWAYGTDLGCMRQLAEYWRTRFHWRAQEARLNAFPQYQTGLFAFTG
jgi:microsomal epoxide hydrolase